MSLPADVRTDGGGWDEPLDLWRAGAPDGAEHTLARIRRVFKVPWPRFTGAVDFARATPADRNRVIDLMRVVALLCVVVGHWLKQGIFIDAEGIPHRQGLLDLAPWTHPVTWLFQVMPIFFLVGGFSNALSWRRAVVAGTTYGSWLYRRTRRLTSPLVPLLVFWSITASLSGVLGLDQDWLRIAGRASLVPTWFLATYLVVVALVPLTLRIWDRFGLASIVAGLLLAGSVDATSLLAESDIVGLANVILVWGTMHQLGYAWLDGALHRPHRAVLLAGGSFAALVALVGLGPYGISMVGVPGFGVDNTYPPRVTLLLLGLWQAGVVLSLEPRLRRVVARPRIWVAIVTLESRLMTIYLWHMAAVGLVLGVSIWSGIGLRSRPDTADWWITRPLWLLVLAGTTLLLTLLLGRYETRPASRLSTRAWLSLTEAGLISLAIAAMAHYGLVLSGGRVLWYLPLGAAVLLIGVARTTHGSAGGST